VALPLVQRGLVVDGIDASPAMLAKLRAKPGGDRVRVLVGDMAEVGVNASYALVFAVFNTLFAFGVRRREPFTADSPTHVSVYEQA
jgi:hypothetical protein